MNPAKAPPTFFTLKCIFDVTTNFLPQPQSIFFQKLKIGDFWRVAAQPHLHVLTHDYFSRTVLSVYFRGRDAKFFILRPKKNYLFFVDRLSCYCQNLNIDTAAAAGT